MYFEGIQLYLSAVCGGISSVTGAAAFNELNQRCLCFACSFRAGSQRDTGFTLSAFLKDENTQSVLPLQPKKISIFQSSMQDLRTNLFEKCCLQ